MKATLFLMAVLVATALHQVLLGHLPHMLVVVGADQARLQRHKPLVVLVVVELVVALALLEVLEQRILEEEAVVGHLHILVMQAALVSSFSSIQNQFHHLQTQQTLGSLDPLALGQHQQEHRMLTTRLLEAVEEEEEMLLVAVALVDSEQEQDYQSHQQHHIQ